MKEQQPQVSKHYKKIFGLMLPGWMNERLFVHLIINFFASFALVIISTFVIVPNFDRINTQRKEQKKLIDQEKKLAASLENLDEFNRRVSPQSIEAVYLSMPTKYEPEKILSSIRGMTGSLSLNIMEYTLGGGSVKDEEVSDKSEKKGENAPLTFTKIPLKITLSGEPSNLVEFVDRFEESLPYGVITNLSMSEISKLLNNKTITKLELEISYFIAKAEKINLSIKEELSESELELLTNLVGYSRPAENYVLQTNSTSNSRGSLFE